MQEAEKRCEQMYGFEKDIRLYDFRFKDTGVSMWMYIRSGLIESLEDGSAYKKCRQIVRTRANQGQLRKSMLDRYIIRNPLLSRKREIVFAFWGYQQMKPHEDGRVYDDLIGPFLEMFPRSTATLMDGEISEAYQMDCAHPNWKMDDIFIKLAKRKRAADLDAADKRSIDGLIRYLEQKCPLYIRADIREWMRRSLSSFARYSKYMIRVCRLYLRIVRPKVMIMQCASYPSLLRTSMILACREEKVVTAELQHCWVGKAYPYGYYTEHILQDRACTCILPDHFLTYGAYWHEHIRMSSQCTVIGYAQSLKRHAIVKNDDILFCAGIDLDRYERFLEKIMPVIGEGAKVYMRFHPVFTTREQKDMFRKFTRYKNFIIADEKDLNAYMAVCRYVITDSCSIPYEALFNGRVVFSFSGSFGEWTGIDKLQGVHLIDGADSFMELWDERDAFRCRYHRDFFDLDHERNYIRFLRKCGVRV